MSMESESRILAFGASGVSLDYWSEVSGLPGGSCVQTPGILSEVRAGRAD